MRSSIPHHRCHDCDFDYDALHHRCLGDRTRRSKGRSLLDGLSSCPCDSGRGHSVGSYYSYLHPPSATCHLWHYLAHHHRFNRELHRLRLQTMNGALIRFTKIGRAAEVSGATWGRILRGIMLPLVLPAFGAGGYGWRRILCGHSRSH